MRGAGKVAELAWLPLGMNRVTVGTVLRAERGPYTTWPGDESKWRGEIPNERQVCSECCRALVPDASLTTSSEAEPGAWVRCNAGNKPRMGLQAQGLSGSAQHQEEVPRSSQGPWREQQGESHLPQKAFKIRQTGLFWEKVPVTHHVCKMEKSRLVLNLQKPHAPAS